MLTLFSIIIFIIFAGIILAVGAYVGMIKKDKTIRSAWQSVLNILRRRYDLAHFLVSVIRDYEKEEDSLLEELTDLISAANGVSSVEDRAAVENEISLTIGEILDFYDDYPDLGNNENYSNLVFSLNDIERQLQVAKTFYNENVDEFNETIRIFPISLVAERMAMKEKQPFNYDGEYNDYNEEYNIDEEDTVDEGVYYDPVDGEG
ncbi:MAG: LemA family protein [Lactobacillaceae bacterium]|jgi:LemA protein|nr:LemA family protein [Lactobacillaceae bacterium]